MQNDTKPLSVDNETHTCERCAPVNIENLANTDTNGFPEVLFTIDDLSQPLAEPRCPTCQILQAAMDVHRSQYTSVDVCWTRDKHAQDFMGTLEFCYWKENTGGYVTPRLSVYDDMAIPRTPKRQPSPKRVDFEQAKTWIDACKESHPGCTVRFPEMLKNLRVIDCVTRSVISAPEDCVYVALSYVWGTSQTCDAPRSSALLDQLPLTVDNSIDATLMLGYRYLWVDKYCIDQTSAADKHDQINQMGDIYSSAELTLIAAAGANSEYGLPGVLRDRERLNLDVTAGRLRFVTTYAWAINDIYSSVWSSRAWTFQEGYTSKRRLYFTDGELVYICGKEVCSDAKWGSETTDLDRIGRWLNSLPNGASENLACGVLREYTRRELTFDSDALNAIVGVLNTLSKAESPIFHVWGVTFGGLPLAIAFNWFHITPCLRREAFPSWSPLGWEGVADYGYAPPVISQSFQVKVWDNSKFFGLSQVKENLNQQIGVESLEKSRCLEITAKLSWLEVRYFSAGELLSIDMSSVMVDGQTHIQKPRAGFHVRIPTGDDGEVYSSLLPCWDSEPVISLDSIRVPCALIPEGDEARSMGVIMLRYHGTYYERIGYFDYLQTYAGLMNFLFKDDNGALTMEKALENVGSYGDKEITRDFNSPEMQTFLLG